MDSTKRTFDGTSDVKIFFFYFENVAMRGKSDADKAYELLAFLDKDAFEFYYSKFTSGGALIEQAQDYKTVKAAFMEKYEAKEDPGTIMQSALEARLDMGELDVSLRKLDELYVKANFNEEAKFAMLQKAVNTFPELAAMALFRGANDYESLKTIVQDYHKGRKTYPSLNKPYQTKEENGVKFVDEKSGLQSKSPKLMVRPDARIANMESKVDNLADQLADLTLLMKKARKNEAGSSASHAAGADIGKGKDRICSFCDTPGHGANRCPNNPNRGVKCPRCGKMGHNESTCWSKKKKEDASPAVSVAVEQQDIDLEEIRVDNDSDDEESNAGNVGLVLEASDDDKEEEAEDLMHVKRSANGEPLQKSPRNEDSSRAPIIDLLNPQPAEKTASKSKKKNAPATKKKVTPKKKKKFSARKSEKQVLKESAGQYDLLLELANASSGLTFGQLLRGDASEAKRQMDRLLSARGQKVTVVDEASPPPNSKCLELAKLKIYGSDVYSLMDSGAIPDVISRSLCERLKLEPEVSSRRITTATGEKSATLGLLKGVPVGFDHVVEKIDFLVVDNCPYEMIIGRPTMRRMNGVIDCGQQTYALEKDGERVVVPLVTEYVRDDRNLGGGTDSEDFTSDSDVANGSSSEESDTDDDEGEFVVMLLNEDACVDGKAEASEEELIDAKIKHLDRRTRSKLKKMLLGRGLIARSLHDLRPSKVPIKHSFELNNYEPIYHKPRRMAPKHNVLVKEEVEKMLRAGIIRPISSAWSFPVVIATKKDGKPRFCVDYRLLNARMKGDRYPIPKPIEIFDDMKGAVVYTGFDFFTGYWQFLMTTFCQELTTFICRYGTFAFKVMPFGLMNAPSTFQRAMDMILKDLPFVRVYLDDIIIFSLNLRDHLRHIKIVLNRIMKYNLKLKISKCSFAQDEVDLLGHIVSAEGVRVDPKKIEKIQAIETPSSATELRSFLGLAGYYRRFIKGFADISATLHAGTSVKRKFEWSKEMEDAFQNLKKALVSPPVLAYPDFDKPFIVETDASKVGVGAVLAQKGKDGKVHPIQYSSRTMTKSERNYHACERESLAVIFALRHFRVYLLSTEPFTLISDHQSLKDTFKKKDIHGRLARWLDFLAEYEFEIQYRPGKDNIPPDFLSRLESGPAPEDDAHDEGEVQLFLGSASEADAIGLDMEERLVDIFKYLSGFPYKVGDSKARRLVRKAAVHHVVWEGKLFRRTREGLRIVLNKQDRVKALKFFHEELGHWNPKTTLGFIAERYWWPKVATDVYSFVRSCDPCQRMKGIPTYHTKLTRPITNLFEVFSIDFAGPIPSSLDGRDRYILICVEHLTNWPIARITENATAEVVARFVEEEVVSPFGPPKKIISDNAGCFTARLLSNLMGKYGIEWKTVLAYAPMSNGRAERMVGTLKRCVGKLSVGNSSKWEEELVKAIYGYRRRPLRIGVSPFELLYGIEPRFSPDDPAVGREVPVEGRCLENIASVSLRAVRADNHGTVLSGKKEERYGIGDLVLVAHGRALTKGTKWPAFKPKFYGPCRIVAGRHPRYLLVSEGGRFTREKIHAHRLRKYIKRPIHLN